MPYALADCVGTYWKLSSVVHETPASELFLTIHGYGVPFVAKPFTFIFHVLALAIPFFVVELLFVVKSSTIDQVSAASDIWAETANNTIRDRSDLICFYLN
jgi:hypothetical protein